MEIEIKWDPTWEKKTKELDEYDKWELAQRIMLPDSEGGMTWGELEECFGTRSTCDIFRMNYIDAREKYITWRKKKEGGIYVGDEVELKAFDGSCIKMVVTNVTDGIVSGISFDGRAHNLPVTEVKKTDRCFIRLINLLKEYDSLDEWAK